MKGEFITFFVLGLVSLSLAGVGKLTEAEEEDILNLYLKVCSDNPRSEGSQVGDNKIYCKHAPDTLTKNLNHEVSLPAAAALGDQIVFVRPPPVVYNHTVLVTGSGGAAQKTRIYVLPQRTEHEISSQYNGAEVSTQKPVVYFLKSDGEQEKRVDSEGLGYRYAVPPSAHRYLA